MGYYLDPTDVLSFNSELDIIRMPGSIKNYGIHSITISAEGFQALVYLDGTGDKFQLTCPSVRYDIEHFEPSEEDIQTNGPENFAPFNIYHLHIVTIEPYFSAE